MRAEKTGTSHALVAPVVSTAASTALSAVVRQELEAAARFLQHGAAKSTARAYECDWRHFRSWCEARGAIALPASATAVATFLASEAIRGLKPSSLGRRLAAIRAVHLRAGHESPTTSETVRATLRGIRRSVGVRPVQKRPLLAELVRELAERCDATTLAGLRDRALLLVGFAGAFRRSELVGIDVTDLEFRPEGMLVHVRRSKTDQEGAGQLVAIPAGGARCPVHALSMWLLHASIDDGAVFRGIWKGGRRARPTRLSEGAVATIVQARVESLGQDPARYGGHSLRAGLLTSAARAGKSIWKMRDQSRHTSVDTLAGYIRDEERFTDNAAAGLL